jgi:hypothetical protein
MIEPYYPNGKRGRPPMGIEKMLRMYLLQMKGGTIVNTTIINTSSSTKNAGRERDPEIGFGHSIDWERDIENRKSSVRCRIEWMFRIMKCQFDYRKTRYRG